MLKWGKWTACLSTSRFWGLRVLENGFCVQSCFTWQIPCCFLTVVGWCVYCFMYSGNRSYAAKMSIGIARVASSSAVVVVGTSSMDWESTYKKFACFECCELLLFPVLASLPQTPGGCCNTGTKTKTVGKVNNVSTYLHFGVCANMKQP